MGCNCSGTAKPSVKWQLTTPTGQTRVYMTLVEARAALGRAGGGTLTEVR
jgi:hypothetical protein